MANKNKNAVKRNRGGMRGKQGSKDSRTPRVNFDNTREGKFVQDVEKLEKDNTPIWYARNKELMNAAASVGFYNNASRQLPFDINGVGGTTAVPGVMALRYVPTLGPTASEAVRQAMESKYSFVVHANSRNQSYTSQDLFLMFLAGIDIFAAIAVGIRVYGLMQHYNGQNGYLPDALISASGFQPADLKKNYSHMLFDLNQLIAQTKQIWIPNDMPIIERRFWMNSNVYMDADSVKGQYYMYTPMMFWRYEPRTETTGGSLQPTPLWNANTTITWDTYLEMVSDMITRLVNESDRGLILGDVLKAYGADKIYALAELRYDYQVQPVYDKEVLSQMENAVGCQSLPSAIIQDQTTGGLQMVYGTGATAGITTTAGYAPEKVLLNFHQKEQPTPEQIMVATRMCSCMNTYTIGQVAGAQAIVGVQPRTCGTEYLYNCRMFTLTNSLGDGVELNPYTFQSTNARFTGNNMSPSAQIMWNWEAFDWAPHIHTTQVQTTLAPSNLTTQYSTSYIWADYDNFIVVDYDTLDRMNTAALFSEFGVPITL